jgi:hypothetical protein
MSTLMRTPRECGSWFWDLDEVAPPWPGIRAGGGSENVRDA